MGASLLHMVRNVEGWSDLPASPFWAELAAGLARGGSFHGENTIVAPYAFSRWPDAIDSFENVAVLGQSVRARAAPSLDARD